MEGTVVQVLAAAGVDAGLHDLFGHWQALEEGAWIVCAIAL